MSTELWTDSDEPDGIHIEVVGNNQDREPVTVCIIPHSDRSEADARRILCANQLISLLLTALKATVDPLELYRAYGWPDRAGVLHGVKAAIAHGENFPVVPEEDA